jgi:hypothetical protein
MSLREKLSTNALLGTSQKSEQFNADGALGEALALLEKQKAEMGAEKYLLSVAALLAIYEKAGRKLQKWNADLPAAAEAETLPCVPLRAELVLKSLLLARRDLIPEWMEIAIETGQRAPEDCLVGLLQIGAENQSLQRSVAACAGNRGVWLSKLNAEWNFIASATMQGFDRDQIRKDFELGDREQRYQALLSARAHDAAFGLELLKDTWKTDSAEDRAHFLSALSHGLSMDDEAFLEIALDDKRKEVRTTAQDLLLSLPASRLLERACKRLFASLQLADASDKEGNLLTKFLPRRMQKILHVEAPEVCDKEMQRDGINLKGHESARLGERAWWLSQMMSQVDPKRLREHLRCNSEQLLELIAASEWNAALKRGLFIAVEKWSDSELASVILQTELEQPPEELMSFLSNIQQEKILSTLLESRGFLLVRQTDGYYDSQPVSLLLKMDHSWTEGFSRTILRTVRTHLTQKNHFIFMDHIMLHIGNHMSTQVWANVQETWANVHYDTSLEKMISTLNFRREMREAFSAHT